MPVEIVYKYVYHAYVLYIENYIIIMHVVLQSSMEVTRVLICVALALVLLADVVCSRPAGVDGDTNELLSLVRHSKCVIWFFFLNYVIEFVTWIVAHCSTTARF